MDLKTNIIRIIENIKYAMNKVGRPDFPKIVAVTKTIPAEALVDLKSFGITELGENYVQEMLGKIKQCPEYNWHFIGTLQKNKAKYIVGYVSLIHSLDSFSLAQEINKRAQSKGIIQDLLIQINQGEKNKGGIDVKEVESFVAALNDLNNLNLKGVMVIPPYSTSSEHSRRFFIEAREIRDNLNKKSVYKKPLTELSMGMSNDYCVAVEEGATILRIGTAIFGDRKKR